MTTDVFEVRSFLQHDSPNGDLVLHSTTGIAIVKHARMKEFLGRLEQRMQRQVTFGEMQDWFGGETEDALTFLKQYGVVREKAIFNLDVNEVVFATNCQSVGELVDSAMRGIECGWSFVFSDNEEGVLGGVRQAIGRRALVCTFLNPYSRRLATAIRDATLNKASSPLLMTYAYNNCLYIDSLYKYGWGLPCHLCQISQIEADLRLRFTGGVTYQNIVDRIYANDPEAVISTPVTQRLALNIAAQLVNRLDRLVTLQHNDRIDPQELRYGYMFDLNTMRLTGDITTHWEICDCYE